MAVSLVNPYSKQPPPSLFLIDDFIGTNGASFNTSIWDHNTNTTHNALRELLDNSLLMSTGNTGGYTANDSNCLRTDEVFSDPEIQFLDFEWLASSVNQEMRIKFCFRASSYLDWYQDSSATTLGIELTPYNKTFQLFKSVSEAWTALGSSVSFSSILGSDPVAGDKWNVCLRHTGTEFQCFIWDVGGSRPSSPSLSASETNFTSPGKVSIGCGNPAQAVQRSFKVGSVWRSA